MMEMKKSYWEDIGEEVDEMGVGDLILCWKPYETEDGQLAKDAPEEAKKAKKRFDELMDTNGSTIELENGQKVMIQF